MGRGERGRMRDVASTGKRGRLGREGRPGRNKQAATDSRKEIVVNAQRNDGSFYR